MIKRLCAARSAQHRARTSRRIITVSALTRRCATAIRDLAAVAIDAATAKRHLRPQALLLAAEIFLGCGRSWCTLRAALVGVVEAELAGGGRRCCALRGDGGLRSCTCEQRRIGRRRGRRWRGAHGWCGKTHAVNSRDRGRMSRQHSFAHSDCLACRGQRTAGIPAPCGRRGAWIWA